MVRFPRRTHSVSGPPSVHYTMKDVACCCNIAKIQQFYMSLMALRRNPQRKCRKEEIPATPTTTSEGGEEEIRDEVPAVLPSRNTRRKYSIRQEVQGSTAPFRFGDLPREIRDHVYSFLVVKRGRKVPVIEAKSIMKVQKKRATAQRTRERLNQKRAQTGRGPIVPKEGPAEPIIYMNILQASQQLHHEAVDCLYQTNWFAISLETFCFPHLDVPPGWDMGRITKMQLEIQLKDSQRMNTFVDWGAFFSLFPTLRTLRIIPSFHSRYYDWARTELESWAKAHFVFRGFFRELVVAIPDRIHLTLGPSIDAEDDMHLEGKAPVSTRLLQQMFDEFGFTRGIDSRD
ncbi:hypothetical protein BDV96DRAFT_492431 [Lophiotrema nucula]|uniref:Uncharacterized protein n=1 Tax=Lophiotrema nucula TaxID=690887 RepID=A0A6A5ZA23_9PLEO|nr:hypothetical protein BDV96DRAFT_492431 [Lophiotrema nucula]